jgi:5-methylcytosine-specific restriction endonuclease McrA
VWDRERRLDARLTRLAKMKDSDIQIAQNRRDRIPEDVRIHVFQRDGGKCQRCGSSEELQFDHIVPVSKGGANAVENVELLCGNCNRLKSDNIT